MIGVKKIPQIKMHELEYPRVALVHTWVSTPQDAGWWRFAFDYLNIPYTYLSEQDLATEDMAKFDVVIMPRTYADSKRLVNGNNGWLENPSPGKKTEKYQHIGIIDETDDVRKGMGYKGVANLKSFIENGGVFITEGSTAAFPD